MKKYFKIASKGFLAIFAYLILNSIQTLPFELFKVSMDIVPIYIKILYFPFHFFTLLFISDEWIIPLKAYYVNRFNCFCTSNESFLSFHPRATSRIIIKLNPNAPTYFRRMRRSFIRQLGNWNSPTHSPTFTQFHA